MKTVLAPIDFSSVTNAVVDEAAALAKAFHGRVVLLTVIQPPVVVTEYASWMDNIGEITAAGEKHAAREIAKLEERLAAECVSTESVQLVGAPVAHIVQQAESLGADYIVMGSHGHKALYDLLVGSTTHGVLLGARCPVIIIPAARTAAAIESKERHAVA